MIFFACTFVITGVLASDSVYDGYDLDGDGPAIYAVPGNTGYYPYIHGRSGYDDFQLGADSAYPVGPYIPPNLSPYSRTYRIPPTIAVQFMLRVRIYVTDGIPPKRAVLRACTELGFPTKTNGESGGEANGESEGEARIGFPFNGLLLVLSIYPALILTPLLAPICSHA